jgi:sucrose phosphorylase
VEQIDLDIRSPLTRKMVLDHLRFFRQQNAAIVRLDAVGYVIKKPGTSCFMVEPEIYEVLAWLTGEADKIGLALLPEVHAEPPVQQALAEHGYWVYNFVLPLLVLHTLTTRSAVKLAEHLRTCPRRQFTMLDCHDGIPVQPDLNGFLTDDEMQAVVDHCLARGANISRLMKVGDRPDDDPPGNDRPADRCDAHQINITYFSALDGDENAYLVARLIQLFAPGIPQVYYVGLLAGANDEAAVQAHGEGRAINRHDYSLAEVESALRRPVVQRLLRLIRLRNEHPAFRGELTVFDAPACELRLEWRQDDAFARLEVDLRGPGALLRCWDERAGLAEERIGSS